MTDEFFLYTKKKIPIDIKNNKIASLRTTKYSGDSKRKGEREGPKVKL